MKAQKLFLGNIVTMDEQQTRAKAMVVQDGKIEFVGSKEDALSFVDSDTEVIDLESSYYPYKLRLYAVWETTGRPMFFFESFRRALNFSRSSCSSLMCVYLLKYISSLWPIMAAAFLVEIIPGTTAL